MAAIGMNTSSCQSWKLACPAAAVPAASTPPTNKSVSPGRTGNSTPDSTKITTSSPTSAHVPKYPISLIGSRKSGINITLVMAHQDTGARWRDGQRAGEASGQRRDAREVQGAAPCAQVADVAAAVDAFG